MAAALANRGHRPLLDDRPHRRGAVPGDGDPAVGPALRETHPAATPILQEYYRAGVGVEVTAQELQSTEFQSSHPWSAVFVSWVMRTAGVGGGFLYSRAHQSYIRAALRSRVDGSTASAFWAYRPTEVAPQVSDLVCASRENSGATFDNIADAQLRKTHCDIVTEVHPGELRVIGGNVNHTVGARRIRIQPNGSSTSTARRHRSLRF